MIKHEAKSAILFRSWLKAHSSLFESCGIECKDTRGSDTFNINEYKKEQRDYALACASKKGSLMRTVGTTGLFDYIFLRNAPTYLVVKYPHHMAVFVVDEAFLAIEKGIHIEDAHELALYLIEV